MDEKLIRESLTGLPIASITFFEEIDSTNARAAATLQKSILPEYSLFIARNQTAGRGRQQRVWLSKSDASLTFTIIIQPSSQELNQAGLFSLLGAMSICQALEKNCQDTVHIKWPNDVLIDGKKTAGVLVEACWQADHPLGLAMGIGVNVLPDAVPIADTLIFPATCIQDHSAKPVDPLMLLRDILSALIELRPIVCLPVFMQRYSRRMAYLGQQVVLTQPDEQAIQGCMAGINESGQLILKLPDGSLMSFSVGDLSLRPV